jgi:excisionase family DNA binding protein
MRDEILTTREAADFLKVSPLTLRRRIHADSLPAHRMGRKWIFIKSELLDWLRSQ